MSEPVRARIPLGKPVKGSSPGLASRETPAAVTCCTCFPSSVSSSGLVTGAACDEPGLSEGPVGGRNVPGEGVVVVVPVGGLVVVLGVVVVSCVVVWPVVFVSDVVVSLVVLCVVVDPVVGVVVVVSSVVAVGVVPRQ